MNALFSLWEKLAASKKYRESFVASVVKRMVPLQIRVLRKQRGWSQAKLAQESRLTQGAISRAEDPGYGNLTVNTLVRIAAGFDCAYIVRFVPFSDLAKWYSALADERALEVPGFDDEPNPVEARANTNAAHQFPKTLVTARLLYGPDIRSISQTLSINASFPAAFPRVVERCIQKSFPSEQTLPLEKVA